MMTKTAVAFIALLVTAAPAAAGVPAILKAPKASGVAAATPDAVSSPDNAPTTPPKGVPGYYYPATRTFTPLAPAQAAPSQYTGETDYAIHLILSGHADLALAFIYVTADNNFGRSQSQSAATASINPAATTSTFVVDQYTRTSTSFSSSQSNSTQQASSYFVTSSPLVQTRIECSYSENLISYATSVFVAQQAPKNGATKQDVTCNL